MEIQLKAIRGLVVLSALSGLVGIVAAQPVETTETLPAVSETATQMLPPAEEPPFTGELKKARDFAPSEQVVTPRDASEYRRADGVLGQARHVPIVIDESVLHERRRAMYEGRTFTDTMGDSVVRPVSGLVVPTPMIQTGVDPKVKWSRVVVIVAPLVLVLLLVAWWRRQMKHARLAHAGILHKQRLQRFGRRSRRVSGNVLAPAKEKSRR